MKNIKVLLALSVVFLNGCAISGKVWDPKSYPESFKNYFIDEENNRVVLIGENKIAYKGKENYNYSIADQEIKEIFEIGIKTGNLQLSLNYPQSNGIDVKARNLGIGFNKKILNLKEINSLHNYKFLDARSGSNIGRLYNDVTLVRYPASKEAAKNYKLASLNFQASITSKNYIEIWEGNTPIQTTGKALITPFALASDIVLLPITIPLFIYNQAKNANEDYYCKGEFCGYNKIPELQKKLKSQ